MAKYVLNTNDEDLNFLLLAMSCHHDQYQMVATLNHVLGIDLSLAAFLPYHLKDSRLFKFSLFSYYDAELGIEFNMLPNTSNFDENSGNNDAGLFSGQSVDESARLVKELPNTDYFLILKGEGLDAHEHKITELLRASEVIMQVQRVEPLELQSRRNLIF